HVSLAMGVDHALRRWPVGPESFAFFDGSNRLLGYRAPAELAPLVTALPVTTPDGVWERSNGWKTQARLVEVSDTVGGTMLRIVVARSTADLRQYDAALLVWFGASIPIVLLLGSAAGYLFAVRALRPIKTMSDSIAGVSPTDLDYRLPTADPPDELDSLAEQFNRLLTRVAAAQSRNRLFLAHAAHQLKTPLTIVRG